MAFMIGKEKRQSNTGIDSDHDYRRPASINVSTSSSVTVPEPVPTRYPFGPFSTRAVGPPGTTAIPDPYALISTTEPGLSPKSSLSCSGSCTRPAESILASMSSDYQVCFSGKLVENQLPTFRRTLSVPGARGRLVPRPPPTHLPCPGRAQSFSPVRARGRSGREPDSSCAAPAPAGR